MGAESAPPPGPRRPKKPRLNRVNKDNCEISFVSLFHNDFFVGIVDVRIKISSLHWRTLCLVLLIIES